MSGKAMTRKMCWTGAAVVMASLLLSACGSGTSASSGTSAGAQKSGSTTISVAALDDNVAIPLVLGKKEGFFSSRGINLVINTVESASLTPLITSGQDQFGFEPTTSFLLARAKNLPVEAVASADNVPAYAQQSPVIAVAAHGPIQKPAQLAGQTIAVTSLDDEPEIAAIASLQHAGVTTSGIHFVDLQNGAMTSALTSGRVQAAVMSDPFVTEGIEQGTVKVMMSAFAVVPPQALEGVWATTESYAASNKELTAAFQAAVNESLNYTHTHPSAFQSELVSFTDSPARLVGKIRMLLFKPGVTEPELAAWETVLHQQNLLSGSLNLDGTVFSG
jgi:NitT/TauT family transport system substrate-binding protein